MDRSRASTTATNSRSRSFRQFQFGAPCRSSMAFLFLTGCATSQRVFAFYLHQLSPSSVSLLPCMRTDCCHPPRYYCLLRVYYCLPDPYHCLPRVYYCLPAPYCCLPPLIPVCPELSWCIQFHLGQGRTVNGNMFFPCNCKHDNFGRHHVYSCMKAAAASGFYPP